MQKGIIVHTVISNQRGEILILQRSKSEKVLPGFWDIPGGTLEDGEDPSVGAIREIKEEAGFDVAGVKLFFHKSNVDVSKNKQFVTLVFHYQSLGQAVVINPEEHDAYVWIDPSKIGDYSSVDYLPGCLAAYLELNTKPIN